MGPCQRTDLICRWSGRCLRQVGQPIGGDAWAGVSALITQARWLCAVALIPGPSAPSRTSGPPRRDNSGMTLPVTEERSRTLTEHLPPYSVILHNDESHSMEYVVQALVKSVPELSTERATEIMLEAHTSDRAVVVSCPLERAELYRDRIRTFGLGVTIEKAG